MNTACTHDAGRGGPTLLDPRSCMDKSSEAEDALLKKYDLASGPAKVSSFAGRAVITGEAVRAVL